MCFNPVPLEINSRISVDLNDSSVWHMLAVTGLFKLLFLLTLTLLSFLIMQWNVIINFPAIKLQGRLYDTFGLLLETT